MTKEDLIEKYVAAHADCRWMDAGDLNDLLHSFVEELDSLVTADKDLEKAAENHIQKVVDNGWEWETQDVADAFEAGAQWQKERMLKDAVDTTMVEGSLNNPTFVRRKIIIVKED